MRMKSWMAAWLMAGVLTVGTPGCQQIAAAMWRLFLSIARDVAASALMQYVERGIDHLFSSTSTPSAQGRIVANPGDPQRGYYDGTMEITVRDERSGRVDTFQLNRPGMQRDAPGASWRLDRNVIDFAKERVRQRFGARE